ncbi:uncharacterized protein LOC134550822 isoform X5 [Prinia subflava]|uniref:uncharacterized protein LOC134550822 isoform X5 n=1 Tax=Prinia subflava TaxID=208062 RepID=UPI002FDFB040
MRRDRRSELRTGGCCRRRAELEALREKGAAQALRVPVLRGQSSSGECQGCSCLQRGLCCRNSWNAWECRHVGSAEELRQQFPVPPPGAPTPPPGALVMPGEFLLPSPAPGLSSLPCQLLPRKEDTVSPEFTSEQSLPHLEIT